MYIKIDVKTKMKLAKLAKDEGRTVKKQVELAIKDAVKDVDIPKQQAGFKP